MWLKTLILVFVVKVTLAQVAYDAYFGKPITEQRRNQLALNNVTGVCTVVVQPCRKDEPRRIDGTCTNPQYPSRGASPTPLLRMLPPKFGLGNSVRPAINGSEMPSARLIRTKILSDGYSEDWWWTTLATHLFVFSIVDSVDLTVLLSYAAVSDCCVGNIPNRANPRCIAIPVPNDDPYLRRAEVGCMNLTRFSTYQDMGCIPNTLPGERYNLPTPHLDLSIVYGFTSERERQIRNFTGGLLISEVRDGVERPPPTSPFCIGNQRPFENACYDWGDNYDGNALSGIFLTAMWFFREHNRLARNLAQVNPCWDDQKLFDTARSINIAQYQQFIYYELMAEILGRKNAIEAGVIYDTDGFVNDFDPEYKPGVFHEWTIGTRWFHVFQDGRTDLYSNSGKYLGTRTLVDDEFRSGILELNNTESDLTQGAFRQPSGKLDYTMDPDLAERMLGERQRASDLPAIDIMRGRDIGLPSYNEYRKICGLPYAHNFDEFKDSLKDDKVEQMKRIYDDVDDVDLMAAIYAEKWIEKSWVGPSLFCIMATNLVQWRKADRWWFEHEDSPSPLTLEQLHEIRKTSMARLLCDNGQNVDQIQHKALMRTKKGNEIVPCKEIPGINLKLWKDKKYGDEKCNDNTVITSYVWKPQDRWSPNDKH